MFYQTDLKQLLKVMLTGDKEEWENCYDNAKTIIQSNNRHLEYLHKIYCTPQKYSMWWLRQHRGNLRCKGSVAAEQNYSSVKSYLGNGSSLSMVDNVKKLIYRHVQHNNERSKEWNQLYVTSQSYSNSPHLGHLRKVDLDSKKLLSHTAHIQCTKR